MIGVHLYGKDSQKVRPSVQKRDLPRTPVETTTCVQLALHIQEGRPPEACPGQSCAIGARERETEGEDRRAHHDGGLAKKNGKLELKLTLIYFL